MILQDRHPPSTQTAASSRQPVPARSVASPAKPCRDLDPTLEREIQTRLAKRSVIAELALDASVDAVAYVTAVNVGQDGE